MSLVPGRSMMASVCRVISKEDTFSLRARNAVWISVTDGRLVVGADGTAEVGGAARVWAAVASKMPAPETRTNTVAMAAASCILAAVIMWATPLAVRRLLAVAEVAGASAAAAMVEAME